jgi:NADH-quinone oxidoreductase subunit E
MFKLSESGLNVVKEELDRYEDRLSAIIPSLYQAQKENGWISQEVIEHLAHVMALPPSKIHEVATFYTMFNKKPVGKYHVQVCCNISCSMAGGRELTESLCRKAGVKEGDVSADGKFTISRVECLGACAGAPMMQINDDYHENLDEEKAHEIILGLS